MPAFACIECGKSLTRKGSLANHLRLHRQHKIAAEIEKNKKDKSEFRCALCSQCFGSQLHLKQHIWLTHKKKPFRCTSCPFSTNYKHSLSAHKARKHQPEYKPHRCRHCKASFMHPSGVQRHERSLHTRQFPVTCPQCEKGFNDEWHLKRHLLTHKKKKTVGIRKEKGTAFKCDKCQDVFSQSAYLKQHIARKHPKAHKKFPWANCDFATDNRGSLWRHRQDKHLQKIEKKFHCEECGKGFDCRSKIRCHLRVHTKEKPFTCDECGKSFVQKGRLICHNRIIHLKVKPFKCADCGKTFATKHQLTAHVESKNGEKIKCERCGCKLAHKMALAQHLRQMHGDQPMFKCWTCGQGLTTMSSLKQHQKNHLAKPILID